MPLPEFARLSRTFMGIRGRYAGRDLWRQRDLGTFDEESSADVASHDVLLSRVTTPDNEAGLIHITAGGLSNDISPGRRIRTVVVANTDTMPKIEVDLLSDTVTRPTTAMRQFMCQAEVGDEQTLEDPTVNLLQEMVAELLGKEAALFLPSGTMCNEISLRVHCRPGDEMIAHRTAHPIHFEGGGPAALAGVNVSPLDGARGQYDEQAVAAAIRPDSRYMPRSRLLWVEQTSNLGGGSIWPLARINAVTNIARQHGMRAHLDGARLMNAVVASGVAAREYAEPFDSAWIDFTKGLGAPVGAALAGSREFIAQAWRLKQQMGGAMRQAGIIAAGGIFALRHHVGRLAEDHSNARRLAKGLSKLPGVVLDPESVETNIVIFELDSTVDAKRMLAALLERGVRMAAMRPSTIRAVTHLDVATPQIDQALEAAAQALSEASR
jgi:threonine aldolase